MTLNRSGIFDVASSAQTAFTLLSPGVEGCSIFLENLDDVNYIEYSISTSVDNVTWSNLSEGSGNSSVSGTLTPTGGASPRTMIALRTSAPFVRLRVSASGGAQMQFGITQLARNSSTLYTSGNH